MCYLLVRFGIVQSSQTSGVDRILCSVTLLHELVGHEGQTNDREEATKRDEHAKDGRDTVGGIIAPIGGRDVLREVPDSARVGREESRKEDERDNGADDDGRNAKRHGADGAKVRRVVFLHPARAGEAVGVVGSGDDLGVHGTGSKPMHT